MDHALVQHLAHRFHHATCRGRRSGRSDWATHSISSSLALVTVACAGASAVHPETPQPTQRISFFVSPAGSNDEEGTREHPFRTIGRALSIPEASEIVLDAGAYLEGEILVSRGVALIGPKEGGAAIGGHIRVAANGVRLSRLEALAGIELSLASKAALDHLHVEPGDHDDALAISASSASLREIVVACGLETCIQISTSTVNLTGGRLIGAATSKRALRVETSSVTARTLEVTGTSINQVLAGERAHLDLLDSRLRDAGGSALAAVKSATLRADRVGVSGARRTGLLVQSSRAWFQQVTVEATQEIGVGIAGGEVDLVGCRIEASPGGAVSISAHLDRPAVVRLMGGTVGHGSSSAILLAQGELTVQGTRFIGRPGRNDTADAIVASGPDAVLTVSSASIESPGGFGVSFHDNAWGTVTATITAPRLGGIFIDGVAGVPVVIQRSHIERCAMGSGIVVQDATDVKITHTVVRGCPEAGVLGGQGAIIAVADSALIDNGQYGAAVFGGAEIELTTTRASGSKWALFATCGDGAWIEDVGGNEIRGAVAICP